MESRRAFLNGSIFSARYGKEGYTIHRFNRDLKLFHFKSRAFWSSGKKTLLIIRKQGERSLSTRSFYASKEEMVQSRYIHENLL